MKIDDVELRWLGHAGFLIKNSSVIYIDPYNISEGLEKADFILITHSHYDHCSLPDLNKIVKDGTKVLCPADCQSSIMKITTLVRMEIIQPGSEFTFGKIKISAIPAYNNDKSYHPKEEGWVGYVVKINDVIIYHAGDTDNIDEMKKLTGYNQAEKKFIALLPVGGKYTMDFEEAAEAAKTIKPFLAIPMHYGSVVGTKEDAENFKKECEEAKINAEVMVKE